MADMTGVTRDDETSRARGGGCSMWSGSGCHCVTRAMRHDPMDPYP